MKQVIRATLALAAAIAFIPSAQADSFGYKITGSKPNANFSIGTGHSVFANGVAEAGAYTMGGVQRDFSRRNGAANNFGTQGRIGNIADDGTDGFTLAGDGGSPFENLLNQGPSGAGILDKGGVLVDISGDDLSLLTGGFSGRNKAGAAGNGSFYFADKGNYYANNELSKDANKLVATAIGLTETPEPGSLFLLGTGLLFLALALFWKSAKRTTRSS